MNVVPSVYSVVLQKETSQSSFKGRGAEMPRPDTISKTKGPWTLTLHRASEKLPMEAKLPHVHIPKRRGPLQPLSPLSEPSLRFYKSKAVMSIPETAAERGRADQMRRPKDIAKQPGCSCRGSPASPFQRRSGGSESSGKGWTEPFLFVRCTWGSLS